MAPVALGAPARHCRPLKRRAKRLTPHTDIAFYGIVQAGRFAPCQQRICAYEADPSSPPRFQVVRRTHRLHDRARPDRRRRSERLRQIQPGGSVALGDGRDLAQVAARRRHGRGDFRGLRQPPGAQPRRSGDVDRQFGPHGARGRQRQPGPGDFPPHRARGRIGLSHQRPRRARPRRADSCSRTPPPARAHRRSSTRARSARSFRPSPNSAAACSKTPPASPDFMPAATRPSCG